MVPLLYLIAQTSPTGGLEWIAPVLQFGVGGGVLIWFMLSCTPRLRGIESSIDRLARSILLLIVSLPHGNEASKQQAAGIDRELDDAERERSK